MQKSPLKDLSKSQIAYFDFESLLIRRFWEMTRVWLESQKNDSSSALDLKQAPNAIPWYKDVNLPLHFHLSHKAKKQGLQTYNNAGKEHGIWVWQFLIESFANSSAARRLWGENVAKFHREWKLDKYF